MPISQKIRIRSLFRGKPLRRLQREYCQRAYSWPQRNLLIIALPKSGSSWLYRMVQRVPGYVHWEPEYLKFLWHDLHYDYAEQSPPGYTVTRTHTRPTDENVRIIRRSGRRHTILLRDLRDVAISWCFYVANSDDHRLHRLYAAMSPSDRLTYFMKTMLPEFTFWAEGWIDRHDPTSALLVRYEDLRADTPGQMQSILRHYGITLPDEQISWIVQRHSFRNETGRDPGQEDATDFNRKAAVGDWTNHFNDEHRDAFKRIAGQALIRLGYETDLNW